MFNNTNYNQQMTMYYKYSISQTNSMSNNKNKEIMIRKLLLCAAITVICLIALFSSLTLFVLYDTTNEIPLTDADIALGQDCKVVLGVSVILLLFIWVGHQLTNAVELKE